MTECPICGGEGRHDRACVARESLALDQPRPMTSPPFDVLAVAHQQLGGAAA